MEFQLPDINLGLMAPEIFLFCWALVVIAFDVVTKRRSGSTVGYLAMFGLLVTGGIMSQTGYGSGFGNMFFSDPASLFFKVIFIGAAFMAIGSSFGVTSEKIINHRGEFLGMILFSTVGMMFLASSRELLTLYIGLELTTIPMFVGAAFFKDNRLSVESGIKYLIIGAFSSALLLYGLSFIYGMTGTTDLLQIRLILAAKHIATHETGVILILANVLLLAGLGFKLALPPFHQWAPDVYEGAPTPITAFLSVGSKAAGLMAFAKVMIFGLSVYHDPVMWPVDWGMLAGIIAAAAMIWGNIAAIRQTNIKRMLAYSSIAQAGYIMVGMLALNNLGLASVSFYMFAYLFANMGAFAVVAIFEDKSGSTQIASYSGLAKTSPFFAACLSVFLLSLAGIPPLAGFLAKYYVFAAAIGLAGAQGSMHWLYWLVGIGLLTSVFALYYYANIIRTMYFTKDESPYTLSLRQPATLVVVIGLVGVILFGLYPGPIITFAEQIPGALGFIGGF